MTLESTKSLAASTSAVEWYKSHAHISFVSKVIYVATQLERGIELWLELCYIAVHLLLFLLKR